MFYWGISPYTKLIQVGERVFRQIGNELGEGHRLQTELREGRPERDCRRQKGKKELKLQVNDY